jgi:hypothetical protein
VLIKHIILPFLKPDVIRAVLTGRTEGRPARPGTEGGIERTGGTIASVDPLVKKNISCLQAVMSRFVPDLTTPCSRIRRWFFCFHAEQQDPGPPHSPGDPL